MADAKLSALTALTGANVATGDLYYIDDVSVTTGKSITAAENRKALSRTIMTPQDTTSGTAWDFSIPSLVNEIVLPLSAFSTNGTGSILVQIGDAGGVETSSYDSGTFQSGALGYSSGGFILTTATVAARAYSGRIVLTLLDATTFTWACSATLVESTGSAAVIHLSAGSKSLSQELSSVRLTTVGPDTGDAGKVGCQYER